jgi:thiol-disulfide isomerase/thioredoxin
MTKMLKRPIAPSLEEASRKKPKVTDDTQIQVTFRPGRLGITADWDTGVVTQVRSGSQGQQQQVKEGMQAIAIDGGLFSVDILKAKIGGSSEYVVTFKKEKRAKKEKCAGTKAGGGSLVKLFGDELMTKNGRKSSASVLANASNIMVYFSAHRCPPCRLFTPQLAKDYKKSSKANKETVVVFVSLDHDQHQFNEYYKDMPWAAVPFERQDVLKKLNSKFRRGGIPSLVVLDSSGKLLTSDGRSKYSDYL